MMTCKMAVLMAALLLGAGCSSDTKSGPGESCTRTADCQGGLRCVQLTCIGAWDGGADGPATTVCELAFNRQKSCVGNLSCASFTDATKKATCEAIKTVMAGMGSYQDVVQVCKSSGQFSASDCENCTGPVKASASTGCTALDELCTCKK